MSNTLIDNSCDKLKMSCRLNELIANPRIKHIRIATGYWDLKGLCLVLDHLKEFLMREDATFQLLIGKDPYIYAEQLKSPKVVSKKYPYDFIKTDLNALEPKDEYKQAVSLLLDYCGSKIQIRLYRKNKNEEVQFLHSKCYIFNSDEGDEEETACGIIGSSNFTGKGLDGNSELNYLEDNWNQVVGMGSATHKTHVSWFEEKWNLSENWTQTFLEQILRKTKIGIAVDKKNKQSFTPYELYIKLLQLKFGDIIDQNLNQQIENYLPSKIQKLNFQIEAVKQCMSIMHEHGGFMLSDVVGLGKTIVSVLLIKRFLTVPEDNGRERRVLIVTPPSIQSAWKNTVEDFDKKQTEKIAPSIDYITTGSIGNLVDNEDGDDDAEDDGEFGEELEYHNYGLIMIDESHKFRNSDTAMYLALDDLIQQIGTNTGVSPYIGLLSATPQNNRPNDIKNQIYLFERNHIESTLKKAESGNLERFFAEANHEYDTLIKAQENESDEERRAREERLKALSKRIRECVLDDILERRTRTDVEKYYKDDMISQHFVFPKIKGPCILKYKMDDELAHLFADTMMLIAPTPEEKMSKNDRLGYYRYRAIQYFFKDENKNKYRGRGSRDSDKVADQLARIMQMLLVKRLESSFTAFKTSLRNLRRYTENMINMWENNTIFVCPQVDVNKELDEYAKTIKHGKKVTFADCVEDIRKRIEILNKNGKNEKNQNAEYKQGDFDGEYIRLLKEDYKLISNLYDRWAKNSDDPKFDKFKEELIPNLFNPKTNTSGKLVIFSEAIDTVESLKRATKNKGYNTLVITAANRQDMENTIKENFDANYEGEQKDDYQVIITTDVLAEGVNLHRANVILNYDTPWNSTRLMQRIGRVNRIGSKEPCIYVYNFMPSAQGDAEIQLVRKAHTKLQSFHILFGEDSKIFSEDEEVAQYALHDAVNGEESPMEKYVFELKQYKENNPERYKKIEETAKGWMIASKTYGDAYFMVKAPRSASLAIKVSHDGVSNPQIISTVDMINAVRVDDKTPACPLPDNWVQFSADALRTYNQYFVRINKSRVGDKRTQAMQIINDLYYKDDLSGHSKKLLEDAMKMVRNGNIDIIRKMIDIGKQIEESAQTLFGFKQNDIDNILETSIGKLVSVVELRQGKAEITLATCN